MSIISEDGKEHSLETEAASLMVAAYAGVEAWAKFWWFPSQGVLEVRSGEECWWVTARRASAWYSERFRTVGGDPQRGRLVKCGVN